MTKYLASLKPIGSFFFSGERSFKFNGDDKEGINCLARSKKFPQQTSILGMIRKEILIINDLYSEKWDYDDKKKKYIKDLIGEKGFNLIANNENIIKEEQDFGIIKNISPTFLYDGRNYYIKAVKDHKIHDDNKKYTPLEFGNSVKTPSGKHIKLPKNYNSKDGVCSDFMRLRDGKIFKSENIFIEDEKIGIKRNTSGVTEDKAFYKQIGYRLANSSIKDIPEELDKDKNIGGEFEFSFAFNIDVDDSKLNKNLDGYTSTVSLGAEGSTFKLIIRRIEEGLSKIDEKGIEALCNNISSNNHGYKYKVILLSDSFIEEFYDDEDYAVSSFIDFRYRVVDKKCKNSLEKIKKGNYKEYFSTSEYKFSFMERGSVIFTDNADRIKNEIDSYKNLKKIGYNRVIVVGGEQDG